MAHSGAPEVDIRSPKNASVLVALFVMCFVPSALLATQAPVRKLRLPHPLRLVVFAPHPDDETLGAGGLIKRVADLGGSLEVVFVTNGDGYQAAAQTRFHVADVDRENFVAFGQLRQREAIRALRALGVRPGRERFLGFPHGGLFSLFDEHWRPNTPYTSPYTGQDSSRQPSSFKKDTL